MSFELIGQTRHLLLGSIIVSLGLWTMPAQAQQVSDAQVNAMVEALRKAAPPNRANDGMYSQWQVLPGIIPSWTKQCVGRELTPAEFESDSAAARNTVACIVRRELSNQYRAGNNNALAAARNVACWWMTGNAGGCSNGPTATYVQRVVGFYQQGSGSNPPARQPATRSSPQSTNPQRQSATQSSRPSTARSSVALLSDNQVAAMVEALRLAAPRTGTPNDGLYSEWQIKPGIIPGWSKQCIGQEMTPAQFETDSQAARTIVSCVMRRELNRNYTAANNNETVAVRRTACWWMTGTPEGCNGGAVGDYVEKVVNFYQQQAGAGNTPAQQPAGTESSTQSTSTQRQAATQPSTQSTTQSSSSTAEASDTQVTALVEALRLAVSGTPKPSDLYSEWRVKAEIIPRWTKECVGRELTPEQFDADTTAARNTVACIMRRELNKQYREIGNDESLAVQRVASWWLTGDPSLYNNGPAADYSQKILALYQRQNSNTSSQR